MPRLNYALTLSQLETTLYSGTEFENPCLRIETWGTQHPDAFDSMFRLRERKH